MDNLMRYLLEAGAYDLAAQFSESVLRARAERLGQEHCDTRTAQLNLESALNRVSRPAKDLPSSDQGSG